MAKTIDGLPVISEETFMKFLSEYPIYSGNNSPEITERIRKENPQIYRIMNMGREAVPNNDAEVYFERGCQTVYELLRREIKS